MKLPLSPRARKTIVIIVAAAFAVCLLLNLRVFNFFFLEDWFEARAVHHMGNFAGRGPFDPNVKIILIRGKQHNGAAPWGEGDKKHREFFAKLIRHMIAAKAKVLAFDVSFDGKAERDHEFGEAVAAARESGLAVIVGAENYINGKVVPEIPEGFNQPDWGLITVGAYQGNENKENEKKPIRALKLADIDGANAEALIPSLPLRIVMASQSFVPELQAEWNQLLLYADPAKQKLAETVPLERGKYLFLDQASRTDLNAAIVDAQNIHDEFEDPNVPGKYDPKALSKYKDAIVLVGYELEESQHILPEGTRLGVELHATAVSNILHQVFIYKLYLIYSYAIIVVMALLALLMDTPLGKRLQYTVAFQIRGTDISIPVPIGLLIMGAIYLATAIIVFMVWRIYLDAPYHLAALGLSYALLWLVFTKLAPPPQPGSMTTLE